MDKKSYKHPTGETLNSLPVKTSPKLHSTRPKVLLTSTKEAHGPRAQFPITIILPSAFCCFLAGCSRKIVGFFPALRPAAVLQAWGSDPEEPPAVTGAPLQSTEDQPGSQQQPPPMTYRCPCRPLAVQPKRRAGYLLCQEGLKVPVSSTMDLLYFGLGGRGR